MKYQISKWLPIIKTPHDLNQATLTRTRIFWPLRFFFFPLDYQSSTFDFIKMAKLWEFRSCLKAAYANRRAKLVRCPNGRSYPHRIIFFSSRFPMHMTFLPRYSILYFKGDTPSSSQQHDAHVSLQSDTDCNKLLGLLPTGPCMRLRERRLSVAYRNER